MNSTANKKTEQAYFTVNYFSNINEEMQRALAMARICQLPHFADKKLDENEANIAQSVQLFKDGNDFVLPKNVFELAGYQFEGWICIRDNHHVMPRPGTLEQSSIYAGKNSIIHKTGVTNSNFLWKSGDKFSPVGERYDFYAQWTPIEYPVSYKAKTIWNEAINWSQPAGSRSIEHVYETKVKPALPRHKFIGWEVVSDSLNIALTPELPEITAGLGEVTIFAVFDRDID